MGCWMRRLVPLLVLPALLVGLVAAPASAGRNVDVIVVFEDHITDSHRAAAATARQHGAVVDLVYERALEGFAGSIAEGRLAALRNDPRVASVELDSLVHAAGSERPAAPKWCTPESTEPACADDSTTSTSSSQSVPWGVERIGASTVAATGAGVHVYVLDTGIDADHPDLKANIGNGYALETCSGDHCKASWDDDQGHGTHVAGTVGALDNSEGVVGVAPQVTLHSVKVLNSNGSGYRSRVIAGIDWVATQIGASPVVVNMSLSGDGSKKGTCTTTGYSGSTADSYHTAICNARNKGAVFAVAAGNAKIDASAKVPAAYDDAVITVSATTSSDSWASYSNWGDDAASWTSNVSAPVAIGAPGSSVLSTTMGGGTGTKSGTSMAAPHVAGAAALVLASGSYTLDHTAFEKVRSALLTNAESTATFTNSTGFKHDEDFLSVGWLGGNTDITPPSAPTGLTATVVDANGIGGANDVSLSWTGVADAARYDVYRCSGTSCTPSTLIGSTTSTTSYVDHDLADGTYGYAVRAVDAAGNVSEPSSTVFATVSAPVAGGALVVASETYSRFGGKTNENHLDVTVRITDGTSVVSGATVTFDLYRGTSKIGTASGTTGSDGTVTIAFRGVGPGCYSADMTHVAKTGYTWDGNEPTNTSCTS